MSLCRECAFQRELKLKRELMSLCCECASQRELKLKRERERDAADAI